VRYLEAKAWYLIAVCRYRRASRLAYENSKDLQAWHTYLMRTRNGSNRFQAPAKLSSELQAHPRHTMIGTPQTFDQTAYVKRRSLPKGGISVWLSLHEIVRCVHRGKGWKRYGSSSGAQEIALCNSQLPPAIHTCAFPDDAPTKILEGGLELLSSERMHVRDVSVEAVAPISTTSSGVRGQNRA